MNHNLSLDCLDTLNTEIIKVTDTSHYNENLDVNDPRLEIMLPGFVAPVVFEVTPGFNKVYNACDLNIQTDNCDSESCSLPDGIYCLRYSVEPHNICVVAYNYLKVSQLMRRYKEALCCLDLNAYEPEFEKKEKLNLLREVKDYIEAAKAEAEFCHEPKKAMELYEYAKKILSKFDCVNCK